MILANCRCHTALSAFSMPNEASLDHNWHSWKIHRQKPASQLFLIARHSAQTSAAAPCGTGELRLALRCVAFMTSFEAIRAWGRVVAELLLSVSVLKSPSAQTAGLIVTLHSSLWFGPRRKKLAASNVADLAPRHWRTHCAHIVTHTRADKERFVHLTGISVQLQKHRQRQTQIYEHTHTLPAHLYMCQLTKTKEREHPSRAWIIKKRQKSLVFFFLSFLLYLLLLCV